MVQVAVNPSQTINQAVSPMKAIVNFFMEYWWVILILIILAVAIAVGFVLWGIIKRERLERDSEAFANYNTTIADCQLNANKQWIKNTWSPLNLLWFGIPFKRNEHSAKLLDADRNLLGYYRGHFEAQDGTINYLVYKDKLFGLVENRFIIKVPKRVKFTIPLTKKHTKSGKSNEPKKEIEINFKHLITADRWNNDIHFQAVGMQKISQFYRTPNFVYNDTRDIIDLRQHMLNTINDDTWKLGYERMVNLNAKMMRKAIDGNPYVQSRKQASEIEQENQEIEKEEDYS